MKGPQQGRIAKDDDSDVISLTASSKPAIHVEDTLEDDGGAVPMSSHGRRESPAVEAGAQPPAASSATAAEAAEVHDSADSEDILIDLEASDDKDAPEGQSSPAGRAASAVEATNGLLQEQEPPQVEHLQVLLDAPGIMPTPICLFRQGDVDWLSMRQVDKLLTDEMFRTDDTHRATAGPDSRRAASCEERAFLQDKGILGRSVRREMLMTVPAACNSLQNYGAPAATIAAMRGLQGAQPMTPVEICKLSLQTLPQSGADADGDENGSDAPPALQQPCQAARAPAWASCSMLEQAGTPAAKHSSLQGVREAPAPPQSSSGLPKEQESLQTEHLQVLLNAPGNGPTPICLFRQGDVDWLCLTQVRKLLIRKAHRASVRDRVSRWPAEKRLAAPREVAFLMEKGAVMAGRATLVTVMAACKALRHFGAPLATVAAVQGLQGAQPMTPAEHKKLQPGSAALREGAAGPEAAGGTAELHKSTAGATVDEDVTQSSAKQRARADWSCHSSNSEQEEQAPRAALQADEAGVGSQPTQAGLETPRQPDHEACNSAGGAGGEAGGVSIPVQMENISSPPQNARQPPAEAPCLPTPMQTESAAAAIAEFVGRSRRNRLGRTQKAAAAAMHGSSSPDAPETPAGGVKRSACEAFGACAERRPGSKILKACGSSADEAPLTSLRRANLPEYVEIAAIAAASQRHHRAPEEASPALETDLIHVPSPKEVAARARKQHPAPFGMSPDGVPLTPPAAEDPALVDEQEALVENIYSQQVLEEYQRRWDAVRGKPWQRGMISEYFLRHVTSYSKRHSEKARDSVVQQMGKWLAFSPEQKRQFIEERTTAVELTDMSHPAYRRFKEVFEPLGLRKKEQGLHFCKSLPEWTLLGEYCGVWDRQEPFSDAEAMEDDDAPDPVDPFGLGPLLHDKVSDLACSGAEAPEAAVDALRAKWPDALQLDPSRARNQLCLINDFRGVPGANHANVAWVEMEDSRTLQPHLFIFTAVSVKAGQEALLDYGEEYHKDMEAPLRKAAHLVEVPEALVVHRALKAREQEALTKAKELQNLQAVLQQERAQRLRLAEEAAEERAQLAAQAEQERARAACMQQQQSAQVREAAQKVQQAMAEEHARLTAKVEEERARAAGLQQELLQAREAASRLKGSAEKERAQLKAQAEGERLRATCAQQRSVQAKEAADKEHAQLKLEAEQQHARATCMQQQLQQAREAAARLAEEADKERARLNAVTDRLDAKAAFMQQQMVQAREAAARLAKEADEERAQLMAQKDNERARATSMQQQLKQAEEAAARLAKEADEERARLEAQAAQERGNSVRMEQKLLQAQEAAQAEARAEAAEQLQQLQTALQEWDAALQQARSEAQSSEIAIQAFRAKHQETFERSAAEIKRLSKVGKGYELQLAELAKHLPHGMTTEDLLALGRTTPLQIIPVGRQHAPGMSAPTASEGNAAQQSATGESA